MSPRGELSTKEGWQTTRAHTTGLPKLEGDGALGAKCSQTGVMPRRRANTFYRLVVEGRRRVGLQYDVSRTNKEKKTERAPGGQEICIRRNRYLLKGKGAGPNWQESGVRELIAATSTYTKGGHPLTEGILQGSLKKKRPRIQGKKLNNTKREIKSFYSVPGQGNLECSRRRRRKQGCRRGSRNT